MATKAASLTLHKRNIHCIPINGDVFEVDERYVDLTYIARGAYGSVCVATDSVTGSRVAIKKVANVFRNLGDAKRVLREIKLLRYFTSQAVDCNMIEILDLMVAPWRRDFEDVYIVTNLMETSLRNVLVSGQALEDTHYKYFLYQILRALKFVHSANVLHRDLKPANVLLNASCELRICDFGLARPMKDDMTPYVQTRWYRAPELLADCADYDGRVDVWSVGCILAELLGRRPLFPGDSPKGQLQRIVKVLGTPSSEDVAFVTNPTAIATIHSVGYREPRDFAALFPKASPLALDLLQQLLQFNPSKRVTAEEALAHPYLKDYHDWEGVVEPTWAHRPIRFDFDAMRMTKQDLQVRIIAELNKHYNPGSPGAAAEPRSSRALPAAGKEADLRDVASTVTATIASTSAASTPSHRSDAAASSVSGTTPPRVSAAPAPAHTHSAAFAAGSSSSSSLSSPVPELSMSARRDAEMEAAAEAARSEGMRQRGARALGALGARGGGGSVAAPSPASAAQPPTAPTAADLASPPARVRAGAGVRAEASGRGAAAEAADTPPPALPPDMHPSLLAMQSALTAQLSTQMDALMGRITDVLQPTQGRVERLERAVQRLASSVGAGDVLADDTPGGK